MSNLSYVEFKTLVIWMPNELRGRVDELSKNSNKEIKKHKNGNRIHKKEPVTYAKYNN